MAVPMNYAGSGTGIFSKKIKFLYRMSAHKTSSRLHIVVLLKDANELAGLGALLTKNVAEKNLLKVLLNGLDEKKYPLAFKFVFLCMGHQWDRKHENYSLKSLSTYFKRPLKALLSFLKLGSSNV